MNITKKIAVFSLLAAVLCLLAGCGAVCEHEWKIDCLSPAACALCGVTAGEAPGHDWAEGDCTRAKTCVRCGITEGEPLEHSWTGGQCGIVKTCITCGKTDGIPAGHAWTDATCELPQTCADCGLTVGSALPHAYSDWIVAEGYDFLRTCTECGTEERVPLEEINAHRYNEDGTFYYEDEETRLAMWERSKQILMEYLSGTWKAEYGPFGYEGELASVTFSDRVTRSQLTITESGEAHRIKKGVQTYTIHTPYRDEEGIFTDVYLYVDSSAYGVMSSPFGDLFEVECYVCLTTEDGTYVYLFLHPDYPYGILKIDSWQINSMYGGLRYVQNFFVKDSFYESAE